MRVEWCSLPRDNDHHSHDSECVFTQGMHLNPVGAFVAAYSVWLPAKQQMRSRLPCLSLTGFLKPLLLAPRSQTSAFKTPVLTLKQAPKNHSGGESPSPLRIKSCDQESRR
jgi:hypothetical protein